MSQGSIWNNIETEWLPSVHDPVVARFMRGVLLISGQLWSRHAPAISCPRRSVDGHPAAANDRLKSRVIRHGSLLTRAIALGDENERGAGAVNRA